MYLARPTALWLAHHGVVDIALVVSAYSSGGGGGGGSVAASPWRSAGVDADADADADAVVVSPIVDLGAGASAYICSGQGVARLLMSLLTTDAAAWIPQHAQDELKAVVGQVQRVLSSPPSSLSSGGLSAVERLNLWGALFPAVVSLLAPRSGFKPLDSDVKALLVAGDAQMVSELLECLHLQCDRGSRDLAVQTALLTALEGESPSSSRPEGGEQEQEQEESDLAYRMLHGINGQFEPVMTWVRLLKTQTFTIVGSSVYAETLQQQALVIRLVEGLVDGILHCEEDTPRIEYADLLCGIARQVARLRFGPVAVAKEMVARMTKGEGALWRRVLEEMFHPNLCQVTRSATACHHGRGDGGGGGGDEDGAGLRRPPPTMIMMMSAERRLLSQVVAAALDCAAATTVESEVESFLMVFIRDFCEVMTPMTSSSRRRMGATDFFG